MRDASFAGKFYNKEKKELRTEIEGCFYSHLGPGEIPNIAARKKGKIYGAIVPHAGYSYSGPCASSFYKELCELEKKQIPELIIIFGTDHKGGGKEDFSISIEDIKTPLGITKIDTEFIKFIMEYFESIHKLNIEEDSSNNENDFNQNEKEKLTLKNTNYTIGINESKHLKEHSIEVQIPFLQYVSGMADKEIKVVPIIVSSINYEKIEKFSRDFSDVIRYYEYKKKINILLMASSDLNHYGLSYGFIPFSEKDARKNLPELDKKFIKLILEGKSKEFFVKTLNESTICGRIPITLLIKLIKILGAKKGFLLNYYNSGEILNDYSTSVGYTSILFK